MEKSVVYVQTKITLHPVGVGSFTLAMFCLEDSQSALGGNPPATFCLESAEPASRATDCEGPPATEDITDGNAKVPLAKFCVDDTRRLGTQN